jgi:hypothetical protein
MFKKALLFLFILLNLVSCRNEFKPLSTEKMSKILMEIHIAEAYAQYVPKDSTKTELKNTDSLKKFMASIFIENKINETEFKESIDWYKSRPELLDSIYQQVLTDIAIWQSKLIQK